MTTKKTPQTEEVSTLPDFLIGATEEEIKAYKTSVAAYEERAKSFDINYFDKDDYIGLPFDIVAIEKRVGGGMQGQDDWLVTVYDRAINEQGAFTFDCNRSRDTLFEGFISTIRRMSAVPFQTLQELPQKDEKKSNPITIVPLEKWQDVADIEQERLERKRERRNKTRGR